MGESITEGTVVTFLKNVGDFVEMDEPVLQIETDKVRRSFNKRPPDSYLATIPATHSLVA